MYPSGMVLRHLSISLLNVNFSQHALEPVVLTESIWQVYRDGTLGREVGRADGRVSACGEHAAMCTGTARDGTRQCDLRGLTDSTFE